MNNRTYKFRAWNERLNKMESVIALEWINEKFDIVTRKARISDNLILMQFTGLYDKNGKEIWEGDVVEIYFPEPHIYEGETIKAVIEWGTASFWWRGIDKKITDCNWHFYNTTENFEVIGNIYEHSELLEGKST